MRTCFRFVAIIKFNAHLKASTRAEADTTGQASLSQRLLSVRDNPPPPQPLLHSGGCYREGRWLITINRTERESERGGRAHRPTGRCRPKPRKWEAVARREERQLYGNTKLIPPSDFISPTPPSRSGERALNLLVGDRWSMGPTVSTAGHKLQHSQAWQD